MEETSTVWKLLKRGIGIGTTFLASTKRTSVVRFVRFLEYTTYATRPLLLVLGFVELYFMFAPYLDRHLCFVSVCHHTRNCMISFAKDPYLNSRSVPVVLAVS